MGWLQKMFGSAEPIRRDAADDRWWGEAPMPTWSGAPVTLSLALQVPAVFDCLQIITQPIAALPIGVFRRESDGSKHQIDDHPLAKVLKRPNERQTGYEFRAQMQWNLAWYKNAYAIILPGPLGAVDQLIAVDPKQMFVRRLRPGLVRYEVSNPDGTTSYYREDQIWHLRALPFSDDGITGLPVSDTSAQAIGAALAVMEYGARYFKNDAKPGGIIKAPITLKWKDDEDRKRWLAAWAAARTGANRHKDALLENGMEYADVSATPEEAQFLETMKERELAVTRIWRVPPHKVGILDRATFSNIEQQALEFVSDTMLPWFELWEQALSRDLLLDENLFVEFNLAALLRGDLKTRYEAYAIGRQWGWLSVNDVRRKENANKIAEPWADEHLRAVNMVPADTPVEQAASSPQDRRTARRPANRVNGHDAAIQ